MFKFTRVGLIAAGVVLVAQGSSRAGVTTILDQIGPNSSYLQSETAYTSQIFGAPNNSFNVAVVDNFSITTAGTALTEVDAAVLGFGSFTAGSYNAVTSVRVEIYSSLAAAASSATGDVADINVTKANITLTTPFGGDQYSALAQLNVNVTLGVGTYYLAVVPALNFSNTNGAEIGVYASNYAGDSNAYQVNPAGGFGFTNNLNALGANAAYRVLGNVPSVAVPEPSSVVILSTGLALAFAFNRFRRARASVS
jgi:hypothetical protein